MDMRQTASEPVAYDSGSVKVLTGVDAIRRRPSLYVGSVGSDGANHLVLELIENAVDEFLVGACDSIVVILHDDGSCSVADNGRGIPVDIHPESGVSAAEILLTQLHSGAKFGGKAYRFSGGLHGLGLTCVNALSELLRLIIKRDGRTYVQEYARGRPKYPLNEIGGASHSGTTIHFLPDAEMFGERGVFSYDRIAMRLKELAYLNPGLRLGLEEQGSQRQDNYSSTTGIKGLLSELNGGRRPINEDVVYCAGLGTNGHVTVDAALQWTEGYAEQIHSFVNSVRTSGGGSHVEALTSSLTRVVHRLALAMGALAPDQDLIALDVLGGLTAVLSVKVNDAEFDSQTKTRFVGHGMAPVIDRLLSEAFAAQLNASPSLAKIVVEHVLETRRTRVSSERSLVGTRYAASESTQAPDVYKKQFGIRSKDWHQSCTWLTDRGLLDAHVSLCRVDPEAVMLDVCCGSGIVGASFGTNVRHKVGLDITPEMRGLARTRLDEVQEGSIYAMPFKDRSFDLVVTREVFHLLPELHRPLSEIRRVLRPGGQLIFGQTVPYGAADAPWMFRIFKKKQPLFYNNYMAEDLTALLDGLGFTKIEIQEYFLWEPIDHWIDTHETSALHRKEIRELYRDAPDDVRDIHPFEIDSDGKIRDKWRWCIFSAKIPE